MNRELKKKQGSTWKAKNPLFRGGPTWTDEQLQQIQDNTAKILIKRKPHIIEETTID